MTAQSRSSKGSIGASISTGLTSRRRPNRTRPVVARRPGSWRVGIAWPRNPLTADLLDRCRVALSPEEFDRAWAVGPTLSREELTREPEPPGRRAVEESSAGARITDAVGLEPSR